MQKKILDPKLLNDSVTKMPSFCSPCFGTEAKRKNCIFSLTRQLCEPVCLSLSCVHEYEHLYLPCHVSSSHFLSAPATLFTNNSSAIKTRSPRTPSLSFSPRHLSHSPSLLLSPSVPELDTVQDL